uniref:Reelin domain-containing protein n=1 Tax=Pseudonaja textilis TaxID=8673 RepID=A0A670Y3J1_PSETE
MEMYSFFGIIFCTVFVSQIFGYPYNGISIACDSMLPDHGSAPQTSSPPYVISVSFDRYDPGNEIQGKKKVFLFGLLCCLRNQHRIF